MPRPSIPAYCHHKGSGQAYVTLDGQRIYLGVLSLNGDTQRNSPRGRLVLMRRPKS